MKQSLNFNWLFVEGKNINLLNENNNSQIRTVNIPHNAKEIPYNYFSEESYQNIYSYAKKFDVDEYSEGKKYILKFDGFMVKAEIILNGKNYGNHYSGYLPVEIDVTDSIKEKENELIVILDSREDKDYPPFGFALDYITFSGIYREVNLYSHLSTYLTNFYIHADELGNINIIYDKVGNDDISIKHFLSFNDEIISEFEQDDFKLTEFKLWDLDNPNLYKLETVVSLNGKEERYYHNFGFRKAEFKKDGFYLNNIKTKLIGLNRHQGFPYMGYAASKALQEDDALLLKETGVNIVRTSHYPQSEHFLNKCDEIGLLVLDEIPGWQHIGQSETWRKECINNTRRMVLKERSHSSLVAYGVRIDESVDDHDLYSETNRVAHELDKYRQTIGVRNFRDSELLEDIYGYNDFSCDSLKIGLIPSKKVKHGDKPYLVTEYLGHMDPVKATSDIDKRIEVALRHAKVIEDNKKYDDIAGAIGWCFVDYHTHTDFGSGDHICPHGVYDLYRNPKLSSYIYASEQDKYPVLEALSNFKPGDVKEAIFNDLYVATNADYIELYKNDEFVGRFDSKNNDFPHLKHPPILLDDIVGKTFKEDKIPEKHWGKVAKMFSYAAMHGFNHLPLKNKIYFAYMMFRYKISYTELVGYWNEYVGSWGGIAKTYKIKGYKDNKLMKEIELGPSNSFELLVNTNKNVLVNEETYDTLIVKIRHVDNHHQLLNYSNRIVKITTNGPIELVGPNEQVLLGGQLTLYFNSKLGNGKGKVTLEVDDIVKEIEVEVN